MSATDGRPIRAGDDRDRAEGTISDRLRALATRRPDDPAVVDIADAHDDRALTWRELDAAVDRTAAFLARLGVRPGESVCFQLPNWSEFVIVSLATLRVGAICCPLMPFFREREVAFVLERSGAHVVFVPGDFRGRDYPAMLASLGPVGSLAHAVVVRGSFPLADGSPSATGGSWPPAGLPPGMRWHRFEEALDGPGWDAPAAPDAGPAPEAFAQLLFTSGTSGEPKGVLHRHATLDDAVELHIRHFGLTDADPIFIPSPLAHQTGFLYGLWLAIRLGAPQILQDVWDARVGLAAVRRWKVAFVQAATPFLADLVDVVAAGRARRADGPGPSAVADGTVESDAADVPRASGGADGAPLRHLRFFVATGATVPRALALQATSALGARVCGGWGSTESCMGTAGAPDDPPEKAWGTDGRPLDGIRVRVTDGRGTALPPEREGEFEVRSPLMFAGYLGHPEWTAAAFTPDGWYRTGDLAVLDADGYVRITGRVKDVINRGGEKVPVAEIEQLLYEHPAVQEVAIVAMPDSRLGERACAFVVPRPGAVFDFAALRRHLDERKVARQYWPERLEVVDALPRTPSGKIQKYRLREAAAGLATDAVPNARSGARA